MNGVALCMTFTEPMGVIAPIALVPTGGSAGGTLAAASNGGSLGLVGGGRGDCGWLERERTRDDVLLLD
jgi:nitronate monooxygenase